MPANIQTYVPPFIKTICKSKDTAFSCYTKDTVFLVPTAKVLAKVVDGIGAMDMNKNYSTARFLRKRLKRTVHYGTLNYSHQVAPQASKLVFEAVDSGKRSEATNSSFPFC